MYDCIVEFVVVYCMMLVFVNMCCIVECMVCYFVDWFGKDVIVVYYGSLVKEYCFDVE